MRPLFCLLALVLVPKPSTIAAQAISPSIYVGAGAYTNLGGELGIGSEVRIGNRFSVNAAVGRLGEETEEEPDGPRRDYDVGVKVYPFANWLYLGINYGRVDYWIDSRERPPVINRSHAFSFTGGARSPSWNGLYVSGFIGTTSDSSANEFFDSFMPRIGLMLGYELLR